MGFLETDTKPEVIMLFLIILCYFDAVDHKVLSFLKKKNVNYDVKLLKFDFILCKFTRTSTFITSFFVFFYKKQVYMRDSYFIMRNMYSSSITCKLNIFHLLFPINFNTWLKFSFLFLWCLCGKTKI